MTPPRQCELVGPHAVDFPTDAALAIPRRLRKSPVLSAARHFSGAARPMDILSLKDSQILFGEGAILPKVSYSSRFEGIATFMGTTSKILEPIVTIVKWSDICCIIPSLWGRDMNILQQLFLPSPVAMVNFPVKFSAPNICVTRASAISAVYGWRSVTCSWSMRRLFTNCLDWRCRAAVARLIFSNPLWSVGWVGWRYQASWENLWRSKMSNSEGLNMMIFTYCYIVCWTCELPAKQSTK